YPDYSKFSEEETAGVKENELLRSSSHLGPRSPAPKKKNRAKLKIIKISIRDSKEVSQNETHMENQYTWDQSVRKKEEKCQGPIRSVQTNFTRKSTSPVLKEVNLQFLGNNQSIVDLLKNYITGQESLHAICMHTPKFSSEH
ncbi:hypothetical protein ACJX0J_019973, partial [Zea mays]